MMKSDIAFLFPGNDVDYKETLQKLNGKGAEGLSRINREYSTVNSELYNQMVTYAICCSICDLYKKQNIFPAVVSGYSLGIYSALYAAEAYSFETGLDILTEAFNLVSRIYDQSRQKFGMGVILGLSEEEIINLVFEKVNGFLEIACLNGHRSFVIVGEKKAIGEALEWAEISGAFKTIRINTGFGYHTSFLKGKLEGLARFLNRCRIFEPSYKILSPISLTPVLEPEAISAEIVKNLYSSLHWQALIKAMVSEYDIKKAYEVGPGESLTKMAKYIDQGLKVHPFS